MGNVRYLDSRGNGKRNPTYHPASRVITIVVFFLLLIIWTQVNYWYEMDVYSDLRKEEETKLILQADSLSMSINKRTVMLEGLNSFTSLHNSCESIENHFFDYIEGMYKGPGGIRNFAIAPDGVQKYVYPPEEGAGVISHNLLNDSRDEVRRDINLTINSNKTILSGPYELRQGGLGLVARKAVFIDGKFFGLISMVIDMPVVFEEVGLDMDNGTVALRTDNDTIYGNQDIFRQDPVIQTIYLYNKEWDIARIPDGGWEAAILKQVYPFKGITLILVFLLTLMTYFVLNRQDDLASSVALRTKELNMEKEQTQKYLDDSGVMFIVVNEEGKVVLVNKKVKEVLGYEEEEILGSNWVDEIIPEPERSGIKEICKTLINRETAESQYCECKTLTKGGNRKLVLWHISVLMDDEGKLTGILAAGKDITESRETENALQKYAEELSIKNEQLKSLDLLKDEFMSNISHELRTPLNSIKGFAEVLSSESIGPTNPEQKTALSRIINSSYKLEKLIDSLLYLASSKKETIECSLSPIDLKLLLLEISMNISQDADAKGIELKMEIDPSLPSINANEDLLGKVFWNLLNNAVKFTPHGGHITLSASQLGERIHVSVNDDGIGIPEDKIESVFDDFYQVDGSPTRKYSGTGIGLFISKKIVNTHGGDIWLESKKDAGTTVHVILPVGCSRKI